ncbi:MULTISPECIES: pyridoxamine 5'-phosphate oxidase family protein [Clostridium]|uniref:pyridoxamine 5'-phosphate oxidase family protein n=1 Tax=Clostridium TaxID=1485 RepID=UPI001FA78AFD|nr:MULTISPECIES: pyridoxamine 5'-phosphate oxidase family protein [Clostridium]
MEKFITVNNEWIKSKKIILIYFNHENVRSRAIKVFGKFSNVIKRELIINEDIREEYLNTAMEIKDLVDSDYKKCPDEILINQIEDFLNSHTTCTLCSCSGNRPIGTPIEYMYKEGYMYFITEGGRKFFNILRNNKVVVSVYEDYKGFDKLNGYQFLGEASIIKDDSEEYRSVLSMKKLNAQMVASMNVMLHVLKVKLQRADIISSDIKKNGYDAKQKYFFK